ncbi:vacuole morphology and inheritance protein 14 [Entomortierella parvispora]|uniref:Vacuole morphology and inheritance protein 14 n=1 Tax=Entomortierella parvispora TaxID=205924 RepID=A0A9P3M210_9FUNG|nr:vacuole morphology and inheritance protein 14 [Entomortierella parvispora]
MSDYILSPQVSRGLSDKLYDKRKGAALEVERVIREYVQAGDTAKIKLTIQALVADFVYSVSPNARNGGLIGLAATSISLASGVSSHLESIVPPVLMCFGDQDSRVRYYACESMYNIAKVARGSILRYFNELFDAMSKLYADSETSVKNGAELLDRLVKDIVHEQSIAYSGPIAHIDDQDPQQLALALPRDSQFSLPRFIPLLAERVYSKNSWTRNYLVTWIAVLDSIPDLELVSYLPDFLDGLLYFLNDSNPDVRTLTQKLLSDFLSEIREVAELQQQQQHEMLQQRLRQLQLSDPQQRPPPTPFGRDSFDGSTTTLNPLEMESKGQGKGSWVPGQGVSINYAKIVKILKPHLTSNDEDIQETALRWINEFMSLAKDVMIQFTPALIPAVLPCLAHSVTSIRAIANETNLSLYRLVYESALPPEPSAQNLSPTAPSRSDRSSQVRSLSPRSQSPKGQERSTPSFGTSGSIAAKLVGGTARDSSNSKEPTSERTASPTPSAQKPSADQLEFDYVATVNALTLQFLNEHEQTRVASLEWLLMLHKRAPHLILAIDDGSFPVLLKTLSDPSEEVIKRDLQLLAQISSHSDDAYFHNFMLNMLSLFSTDRRLLENRGSVIIRQLCVSLNSERIYRALAEILEKDEDLEFANTMVQNLNIILITAPELADLRKRLKTVDSRDGQALFTVLYRSWCHNPVSTFALCLMAQYYEHAVALLQSFAELEITVNLLIQVDKLVQLIESPVFTYLRLQLLEPERYPHLFKCLYGLLMLLPQSTAFATLRNRLTSVSSMGFIHLVPKINHPGAQNALPTSSSVSGISTSRTKSSHAASIANQANQHPEGPRFPELLSHFRTVQGRHERSRRQAVQALLRLNTYGNSSSGLAGTAHYNQQQQYYQQHQQKHQRKQQQQLEHQQLQQQVQQQQQLYDLAQQGQQQQEQYNNNNSSSASRYQQQEGSYSNTSQDISPDADQTTAPRSTSALSGNVVAGRRRTRDRQSQLDILPQQSQGPTSSASPTGATARNSYIKGNAANTNSSNNNYRYSSGAGTPPPPAQSSGGGNGSVGSSPAGGNTGGDPSESKSSKSRSGLD